MNGKPLPFDTYYYIMSLKSGRKPVTGYVTIRNNSTEQAATIERLLQPVSGKRPFYEGIYLMFVVSVWSLFSFGQAKPSYTQYIPNNYILNPALTGIENYTDINLVTGINGQSIRSSRYQFLFHHSY